MIARSFLPTTHLHLRHMGHEGIMNKALVPVAGAEPCLLQSKLGQLPGPSALVRIHQILNVFEDAACLVLQGQLDAGTVVSMRMFRASMRTSG